MRALIASDRLLLADDMGLGKTLQVIAALRILKHRERSAPRWSQHPRACWTNGEENSASGRLSFRQLSFAALRRTGPGSGRPKRM